MNETEQQNAAQPATPAATLPLQLYRSHKLVQAALILGLLGPGPLQGNDGARLVLEVIGPDGRTSVEQAVSAAYMQKHDPREGGYYVRYEDGYESFSPAEAFEKGYARHVDAPSERPTGLRQIRTHHVNDANKELAIAVLDEPGPGGASHLFEISGFSSATNPSDPWTERYGKPSDHSVLLFQNGGIAEKGVNGVTHEALLAIVVDRLHAFQAGPHACEENRQALLHLRRGIEILQQRTLRRLREGIEGKVEGS